MAPLYNLKGRRQGCRKFVLVHEGSHFLAGHPVTLFVFLQRMVAVLYQLRACGMGNGNAFRLLVGHHRSFCLKNSLSMHNAERVTQGLLDRQKASKKTPPSAEGASAQRTSPLRGYRSVIIAYGRRSAATGNISGLDAHLDSAWHDATAPRAGRIRPEADGTAPAATRGKGTLYCACSRRFRCAPVSCCASVTCAPLSRSLSAAWSACASSAPMMTTNRMPRFSA